MNRIFILMLLILPAIGISQSLCGNIYSNFVPDSATAVKIAEAVWLPIYGESIYKEKPFITTLKGDSVWYVYGSMPHSHISINGKGDTTYYMQKGGVAEIKIRRSDGQVLYVCHGK